ncbi:hypothetical protein N473_14945 [Pseudoalteromonas luteoviolacea CPMOR-1]|uniref:Uncharacterized protein n=1 Tax=Pseudoalteromonas luteoviolacea CPMOR-1 TaxID=1365248 RepID=A0A167LBI8_9GAMM|nr:hypothetical protein N473_14945 [Pseudoalteromonas luteoviolacea CPMOR-1]
MRHENLIVDKIGIFEGFIGLYLLWLLVKMKMFSQKSIDS